ncbi:MAG: hypothetical protein ACI8S2_001773, partial [Bacteroidia bacterium]
GGFYCPILKFKYTLFCDADWLTFVLGFRYF